MWAYLRYYPRCFVLLLLTGSLGRKDMSMTYESSLVRVLRLWRMSCKACVIVGLMWTALWATGCSSVSLPKRPTLNIYQAPLLRLTKGTRVHTKEGVYEAQADEVWHSDARFRQLEIKLINK